MKLAMYLVMALFVVSCGSANDSQLSDDQLDDQDIIRTSLIRDNVIYERLKEVPDLSASDSLRLNRKTTRENAQLVEERLSTEDVSKLAFENDQTLATEISRLEARVERVYQTDLSKFRKADDYVGIYNPERNFSGAALLLMSNDRRLRERIQRLADFLKSRRR